MASIQSIYKLSPFPKINLLIVDEAHRYHKTKMYKTILDSLKRPSNPKLKIIYFTATPFNNKSGYIFGKDSDYFNIEAPCYTIKANSLVKQGYLCDITFQSSKEEFDTRNLKISNGDFLKRDLDKLTKDTTYLKTKCDSQIDDALARCKKKKKILWCCINIAHAELIEKKAYVEG